MHYQIHISNYSQQYTDRYLAIRIHIYLFMSMVGWLPQKIPNLLDTGNSCDCFQLGTPSVNNHENSSSEKNIVYFLQPANITKIMYVTRLFHSLYGVYDCAVIVHVLMIFRGIRNSIPTVKYKVLHRTN